jgi:hypothetical protein
MPYALEVLQQTHNEYFRALLREPSIYMDGTTTIAIRALLNVGIRRIELLVAPAFSQRYGGA